MQDKPQTTKHFPGNSACECAVCLPDYASITLNPSKSTGLVRLPDCYICGKPLNALGAIDLEIGVPDANGYFSGRKWHRHEGCKSALS